MRLTLTLFPVWHFSLLPFPSCRLIPLWITRRKWKDPTLTLDGMERIFKCFPLNNCVLFTCMSCTGWLHQHVFVVVTVVIFKD